MEISKVNNNGIFSSITDKLTTDKLMETVKALALPVIASVGSMLAYAAQTGASLTSFGTAVVGVATFVATVVAKMLFGKCCSAEASAVTEEVKADATTVVADGIKEAVATEVAGDVKEAKDVAASTATEVAGDVKEAKDAAASTATEVAGDVKEAKDAVAHEGHAHATHEGHAHAAHTNNKVA